MYILVYTYTHMSIIYRQIHCIHIVYASVYIIYSSSNSCAYSNLCNPTDYSCQAPLSMGFSRQKYWSGLPFPTPGDLPNTGFKPLSPESPALQADSLLLSYWGSPIMYSIYVYTCVCMCVSIFSTCVYILYIVYMCVYVLYICYI